MNYYIARDCVANGDKKLWTLQNILTGAYVQAEDSDVKRKIKSKQVDIANLTLTSDNRLVRAAEYKFEAFKEMMQAPQELLGYLTAPSKDVIENIESSLDREISQALRLYSSQYEKYVIVQETDSDKNLIVAQFKVGEDTYLLIKYQKVVYGVDKEGDAYFDCLLGVEAIRCGNICEHIKSVPSKLSSYISSDLYNRVSDELFDCHHSLRIKPEVNGRFQLDNDKERMNLATAIMQILADQMDEIVISNPSLSNNVDVNNCITYDETRKEYIKTTAMYTGIGAAGTLVLGAISAVAIATNPDIIQTGLLAKIANVGSAQQILATIRNVALVGGGATGALLTTSAFNKAGVKESRQNMKKKMNESKLEQGKTFDDAKERERRKERALMKERALQWEAQQSK